MARGVNCPESDVTCAKTDKPVGEGATDAGPGVIVNGQRARLLPLGLVLAYGN